MCDDGPPPDVPLPVPAGYRAMPLPSPEALSHAGVAGRTLLHAPVLVRWPAPYGWTLGHITARCTRGELDAGTPAGGARATFRVEWCDDAARPGVATHHSYHHLSAQRFADGGDAPDWSWALLAPLGTGADGGGEGDGTRGCGWLGCPGPYMGDTMYLLYNTMYPLRIRLQSRYVEIQYILYPLYLDQIQWIRSVSALGPDTVDTYRP